jgi:hypothetical protein
MRSTATGRVAVAVASLLLASSCTRSSPKGSSVTATTLGQAATSTSSTTVTPPIVASTTSPVTVAPVDAGSWSTETVRPPSVEPSEIVLTCADYGWILKALHWSSWTASQATAIGTFV